MSPVGESSGHLEGYMLVVEGVVLPMANYSAALGIEYESIYLS
jgi:hypothetical protein